MGRIRKTERKGNEGFTLMELIVVLAILAVLAGITVPVGMNYIERARQEKQQVEGRQLFLAVTALILEDPEWERGSEDQIPFESVYWKTLDDRENPLYGYYPSEWDPQGMVMEILTDGEGTLHEITYEAPDGSREIWNFSMENGQFHVEVTKRDP